MSGEVDFLGYIRRNYGRGLVLLAAEIFYGEVAKQTFNNSTAPYVF